MIKLTKVVAHLTEDAEKRMVEFEDQLDSNIIKPAIKDEHGNKMSYYEDLNVEVPSFFYENIHVAKTTIDFEIEDYVMTYYNLFIEESEIKSIEDSEQYTVVTMKDETIWAVKQSALKVFKKRKKYLQKSLK
jgi:hypothetical protein